MEGHSDSEKNISRGEDPKNAKEQHLLSADEDFLSAEEQVLSAEEDFLSAEEHPPSAEEKEPSNAEEAEFQVAEDLPPEDAEVDVRRHVPLEPDIVVVEGPCIRMMTHQPGNRQSSIFSLSDLYPPRADTRNRNDDIWPEPLPVSNPWEPQSEEDMFSIPEDILAEV
ncbi:hypothetical protein EB796_007229 [Bugula neritina]|uniref:Uncharacterized protein n=1 Tax=Bugula neritina TaxID=10212 RepID=A0A7J7K8A1_BUGNE|nr:hypothetical protein EB796_007229 [Bugula neritina]